MKPPIAANTADSSRERPIYPYDPRRELLAAIRSNQRNSGNIPHHFIARKLAIHWHRFLSTITQCDIDLTCRIAGGQLPHPNGIVIHPKVIIGPNCLIFQQVTLGTGGPIPGVPCIGGHVDIGAGAKILGGVTIGNHVKIGSNAVVLCHVPEGASAVGIPARIV